MSYLGGCHLRISHPTPEFLFVLSSGTTATIPRGWTVSFQRLISKQSLLFLKLDGDRGEQDLLASSSKQEEP